MLIPSLLPPIHLLTYSALLGTQLYQTFILNGLTFRALPRPFFTNLQRRLFPIYFRAQLLLLCLVTLTLPPRGLRSVFQDANTYIALGLAGVSSAANWGAYGPKMDGVVARKMQMCRCFFFFKGKRVLGFLFTDVGVARRQTDEGHDVVEAEKALGKEFSRTHAMCIHLNLVTISATVWYGWRLATRFDFGDV
jgi:hypothetical protein